MAYDSESKPVNADLLILQRARDRVAKGWTTCSREDDAGNVCLRGALAFGRGLNPNSSILYEQNGLARLMGFSDEADAMMWNDIQPSAVPVLARFDQAIDRLARS